MHATPLHTGVDANTGDSQVVSIVILSALQSYLLQLIDDLVLLELLFYSAIEQELLAIFLELVAVIGHLKNLKGIED